ncbi:hypothetical protein DI270_033770 [Microbispora triticiradicis]|uniref:Uncharacterized protein n=1 Tax=Microbispora triticiradicis TaxID=2200763 RepID=A0ABX9L9K3_9ACTN|nr:hypothetical protein DI270_033770 [Microbispora triticiradicis]
MQLVAQRVDLPAGGAPGRGLADVQHVAADPFGDLAEIGGGPAEDLGDLLQEGAGGSLSAQAGGEDGQREHQREAQFVMPPQVVTRDDGQRHLQSVFHDRASYWPARSADAGRVARLAVWRCDPIEHYECPIR